MSAAFARKFRVTVQDTNIIPDPVLVDLVETLVNRLDLGDKLEASFEFSAPTTWKYESGMWVSSADAPPALVSAEDYSLVISCITEANPKRAAESLAPLMTTGSSTSVIITPFVKQLKRDWVIVVKPETTQCLSLLRITNSSMTMNKLVLVNPDRQGADKYNMNLVDRVEITKGLPARQGSGHEFYSTNEDVQMHKVVFKMLASEIPTNILAVFKFLMILGGLGPTPLAP